MNTESKVLEGRRNFLKTYGLLALAVPVAVGSIMTSEASAGPDVRDPGRKPRENPPGR
jgi:nitrous oxide reductase